MKRSIQLIALLITIFGVAVTGCKKEKTPAPEKAKAVVDKVEIGLGNNGIGIIDADFHFQAEVLAATKIENVSIKIQQRIGETYSKVWVFEKAWPQYRDAKNSTVHEHITIPADAPEGRYDFLIVVKDQNGTTLEEKKEITLYQAANLPVNPSLSMFVIFSNGMPFYLNKFMGGNTTLKKDDVINSEITIDGVKGDGKMYILLINKKLNHRPESIEKIDFSKAMVYDVAEHKDWINNTFFSNASNTGGIIRSAPLFKIGAAADNNLPIPNDINGSKAWESGSYYFGVIYKNTTYNMSAFSYIELDIKL